jgi:hypothetical protein
MSTGIAIKRAISNVNKSLNRIVEGKAAELAPGNREAFRRKLIPYQVAFNEAITLELGRSSGVEENAESEDVANAQPLSNYVDRLIDDIYISDGENDVANSPQLDDVIELRAEVDALDRRLRVQNPVNQEELEADLRWMAERGEEDDLELLDKVTATPPYNSKEISKLPEIAKARIIARANDPQNAIQSCLAAYQQNKEEWDRQYADQYVALSKRKVIDSDKDKLNLIERLMQSTVIENPFPVCIGDFRFSPPDFLVVSGLGNIKDRLNANFSQREVQRWLHKHNKALNGRTPLECLAQGETTSILDNLIRIEEGVHL